MDQTQPSATGEANPDPTSAGTAPPPGGATAEAGVVVGDVGEAVDAGARRLTALIVDWGGVLTNPLDTAMTAWATADGVDFAHFADVMKTWVGASGSGPVASGGAGGESDEAGATADVTAQHVERAADGPDGRGGGDGGDGGGQGGGDGRDRGLPDRRVLSELDGAARLGLVPSSPVHALERGEISVDEFERQLAAALGERGSVVEPVGLLGRVLGGLEELRPDMLGLVRRARHSGLRTALLSNSWGDNYPEDQWEGAFDVVVISGRVGMRKPDAEIFHHAASLLGVPPEECVMVDDLAGNVRGAADAGMVGVLHKSYEETVEELEILFDRPLR